MAKWGFSNGNYFIQPHSLVFTKWALYAIMWALKIQDQKISRNM